MTNTTPQVTHENQYIETPSARFAYRWLGPRSTVPIVLVHRFRATIDWWDPEFLALLSTDRDVILFDNIGIGYTEGEPLTTTEEYAKGAIEFIEALGLTEVDLLGWSFGGVVAQAPRTSPKRLQAHVFGDDDLHDLAGAAVDAVHSVVGVQPRNGVFVHVSVAAVELEAAIDDLAGGLGAEQFH